MASTAAAFDLSQPNAEHSVASMNARVERKVDRMAGSSDGRTGGLGTRDAIRVLRLAGAASRASGLVTDVTGGTILELMPSAAETPRLQPASPVEGEVLQVREVGLGGGSSFVAFLDGVQASRVVCRVGTAHRPASPPDG